MENEGRKTTSLIIFGAGNYGIEALQRYGRKVVHYFCDNDTQKIGTLIRGVPVINFDKMIEIHKSGHPIMICMEDYTAVVSQLEKNGVDDYLIYRRPGLPYISFDSPETEEYTTNNKWLEEIEIQSKELDLLEDVNEYRKLSEKVLIECKDKNKYARYMYSYQQEYYYGNTEALFEYGNVHDDYKKFFPIVSHFDIIPWYSMQFYYNTATIVTGDYFKSAIQNRHAYLPVFCVGPYIHYAESYYDADRIEDKKKDIGRMMLVFLPHTVEGNPATYDGHRFIDKVLSNYKNSYDSFWMCVYWTDINTEVCNYAESKGIKIVSAGIRTDRLFLSRLKSMMELADSIVCGDAGTFLSYASYMGKPIALISIDEKDYSRMAITRFESERKALFEFEDFIDFMNTFNELFDESPRLDNKQKAWLSKYSDSNKIRDGKYIRMVSEISYDLWKESGWNVDEYPHAIHKTFRGYEIDREFEKMSILQEAVGDLLI